MLGFPESWDPSNGAQLPWLPISPWQIRSWVPPRKQEHIFCPHGLPTLAWSVRWTGFRSLSAQDASNWIVRMETLLAQKLWVVNLSVSGGNSGGSEDSGRWGGMRRILWKWMPCSALVFCSPLSSGAQAINGRLLFALPLPVASDRFPWHRLTAVWDEEKWKPDLHFTLSSLRRWIGLVLRGFVSLSKTWNRQAIWSLPPQPHWLLFST